MCLLFFSRHVRSSLFAPSPKGERRWFHPFRSLPSARALYDDHKRLQEMVFVILLPHPIEGRTEETPERQSIYRTQKERGIEYESGSNKGN